MDNGFVISPVTQEDSPTVIKQRINKKASLSLKIACSDSGGFFLIRNFTINNIIMLKYVQMTNGVNF
jgi:hypothetical protein